MPFCYQVPDDDSEPPCLDSDWEDDYYKGTYEDPFCKCVYEVVDYKYCVHADDKFCNDGQFWIWILIALVSLLMIAWCIGYFCCMKK